MGNNQGFVRRFSLATWMAYLLMPLAAFCQTGKYDEIVAQAQADLKAGNTGQALTESQNAITAAPSRWEAYVVAGGALQVEQQYEKAIDDFAQALKLAPQAKQAAVQGLVEKCKSAQAAAQPAPTPAGATGAIASQPLSPQPASTNDGPSYNNTVAWITAHVGQAGVPAANTTKVTPDGTQTTTTRFSVTFDACNTFTVNWQQNNTIQYSFNVTPPQPQTEISRMSSSFQFNFKHVTFIDHSRDAPPEISFGALDGVGYWQFHLQSNDPTMVTPDYEGNLDSNTLDLKKFKDDGGQLFYNASGPLIPGISLPFALPGADDLAPHVFAAFQHLAEICKDHPEEAPKSLF